MAEQYKFKPHSVLRLNTIQSLEQSLYKKVYMNTVVRVMIVTFVNCVKVIHFRNIHMLEPEKQLNKVFLYNQIVENTHFT